MRPTTNDSMRVDCKIGCYQPSLSPHSFRSTVFVAPLSSRRYSRSRLVWQGIIETTGNPRFAYDTYRRFLNMYSDVVMDLDKEPFEEV